MLRIESAAPPPRWSDLAAELTAAAERLHSAAPGREEEPARTICGGVMLGLWDRMTGGDRRFLPPFPEADLGAHVPIASDLASAADVLADLPLIEASYRIGLLYTDLLPAGVRAQRGAYYTPPILAERLLDLASAAGADWAVVTVLDPASGGGAFLMPVAARMLGSGRVRSLPARGRLDHLEGHLAGIEIDPFAAWMTRVFLQLLTDSISRRANRPLRVPVQTADALREALRTQRRFDLIVGNPPYGRLALPAELREQYARSLFGHANLYGMFLDAALRFRRSSGLVAFLTPTSFLGGQYFSKLRSLLLREAPPLAIDLIADRTGVFPSVQQETCLAVFGPARRTGTVVHVARPDGEGLEVTRAGSFRIGAGSDRGGPWLLPRAPSQAGLTRRASLMKTRLHTLGYRASTGPLVWNRCKGRLRAQPSAETYPLIWAEAVRPNEFRFDYRTRAEQGFIEVSQDQPHVLLSEPCVLVQRTTAKEQKRRLVACHVPDDFLERWGSMVVENHVNVLLTHPGNPVPPRALAAVLNTRVVDEVFRCLSGSVAVSATELHALPLPPPSTFRKVAALCGENGDPPRYDLIEAIVAEAYEYDAAAVAE